jgi:hypothetical protein
LLPEARPGLLVRPEKRQASAHEEQGFQQHRARQLDQAASLARLEEAAARDPGLVEAMRR